MTNHTKKRFLCLFIILTSLLSACVEHEMTDLKKYVSKIKARKNPPIEPIPEYKHIPNYYYGVHKLRNPFIAFIQEKIYIYPPPLPPEKGKPGCPEKPKGRVQTGLERMPLDALQMVGTLEATGTLWALVASKTDGTIYQVKQHDYIGVNEGKIINITHGKIDVLEQLPDDEKCWKKKTTTITMISQ